MWFCVKPERAAQAFQDLRALKVHPHTPGYLAVRRALGPARAGRESTIGITVRTLYDDYLAVEGTPDKYPYARPFAGRGGEEVFNRNVAGSLQLEFDPERPWSRH